MDKDEIKNRQKRTLKTKETWLLMGLVLALAAMFVAFEWSTGMSETTLNVVVQDVIAEEEIEIPVAIQPSASPPPPQPEAPEILEVVGEKVETRIQINIEDDQSRAQIQTFVPPPPPPKPKEEATEEIFVVVEEMPEFPGGQSALMKYLSENIRYPVIAQENGIEGRVICSFVVERDGSITDVQVVRGVDPSLDKEAVRVIQSMPKWKPGKQRGKPVRVRFTLPIVFRLQQ